MLTFTAPLLKFGSKGEKTGWTHVEVPVEITETLNPGVRTWFRVRGRLDECPIKAVALVPMGDGSFILPVNTPLRRALRKEEGATIRIELERDNDPVPLSPELLACLEDAPEAQAFFNQLTRGHQNYFSNWIEDAKTVETRTRRLTRAIRGLSMCLDFGQMIRYFREQDQALR